MPCSSTKRMATPPRGEAAAISSQTEASNSSDGPWLAAWNKTSAAGLDPLAVAAQATTDPLADPALAGAANQQKEPGRTDRMSRAPTRRTRQERTDWPAWVLGSAACPLPTRAAAEAGAVRAAEVGEAEVLSINSTPWASRALSPPRLTMTASNRWSARPRARTVRRHPRPLRPSRRPMDSPALSPLTIPPPPVANNDSYSVVHDRMLMTTSSNGVLGQRHGQRRKPLTASLVQQHQPRHAHAQQQRLVHVHADQGLRRHRQLHSTRPATAAKPPTRPR